MSPLSFRRHPLESAAQSRSVSIFPSKCILVPSVCRRLFRRSPEPAIPRPSLQDTRSEYNSLLAQELAQAVLIGGLLVTFMRRVLLLYSCLHLVKALGR